MSGLLRKYVQWFHPDFYHDFESMGGAISSAIDDLSDEERSVLLKELTSAFNSNTNDAAFSKIWNNSKPYFWFKSASGARKFFADTLAALKAKPPRTLGRG